jgi:hypothetical protein
MGVRHVYDNHFKALDQQSKSLLALAAVPALTLGLVVKDGAWCVALEAALGLVIEIMDGDFDHQV